MVSGGEERLSAPSCVNLWRWAFHRCRWCACRTMAKARLAFLIAAVFCGLVVSVTLGSLRDDGPDFASGIVPFEPKAPGDRRDSQGAGLAGHVPVEKPRNSSMVHTAQLPNKTRHVTQKAEPPAPPPKKKATSSPAKVNITELISEFSKVYAHNFSEDNELFFPQLKQVYGKQWKPHVRRTEKFRREIRAALGAKGKSDNMYLTKHNTPRQSPMIFYMAGKRKNISDPVWNTLPNTSVLATDKFDRCSVVGSSGLLYKSNCGKRIDNADFVVRFNLAPVKGFEADVGSKTNFTSLNPTFIMRKMNSLRHPDNYTLLDQTLQQFRDSLLYLPAYAVSGSRKLLVKTATVTRELGVAQPIYGSPYHFLAVATVWRKALDMGLKWPSTGLYAISSLLDACRQINVYGFWPFQKGIDGKDVPYHYHNKVRGTAVHKFDKEFKMLFHLHSLGIIHLQLQPC